MTIQGAIRSGKPFRRKGWTKDMVLQIESESEFITSKVGIVYTGLYVIQPFEILATDWEVKS
jgi:hypothetical protein